MRFSPPVCPPRPRRTFSLVLVLASLLAWGSSVGVVTRCAAAEVWLVQNENAVSGERSVVASIDGQEFTVLHYGPSEPKPYFWPVRAADGTVLTRANIPGQADHPHHRGIWISVDEVNGLKHWAENNKVQTQNLEILDAVANPARLQITNHWLDAADVPLLIETTTVSIFANRLMVFDISLKAAKDSVVIGDTKEGFLAFRFDDGIRGQETGKIVNSSGQQGEDPGCWGMTADWVDYFGQLGGKTYGVTLFDHPNNFRRSRYHCRSYGLFAISPFGEGAYQKDDSKAAPVTLNAERPEITLRYGLYVHSGDTTAGEVEQRAAEFRALP